MEEMWEKGMPYDEYESVISFLQKGSCATTASTSSNSDISEEISDDVDFATTELTSNVELDLEGETNTYEESESSNNEDNINTQEDDEEEEVDGKEEQDNEESSEPATTRPRPTMIMKLDTVAGFENLTDAVFALTQWVKQAASEEEVRSNETCAPYHDD